MDRDAGQQASRDPDQVRQDRAHQGQGVAVLRRSTRFRPTRRSSDAHATAMLLRAGTFGTDASLAPAPGSGTAAELPTAEARQDAMRAGFEFLQAGRFEEARAVLLPHLRPDDVEAALLGGLALAACGDAAQAAPLLNDVALCRPQAQHPCLELTTLLRRHFRTRLAEPVFRACLALSPDDNRLRLGFAQLLTELQQPEAAMVELDRCLDAMPGFIPALNQRGIVLVALGRIEEALAVFHQVVEADPGNAAGWANIGCTLTAETRFEEALSAYRRSIHARPKDPQVRLNHSIALLKAGRMAQGWQEHEWRFQLPGHTQLPLERLLPTLGPDADLTGRSVLLTHEEGIGDTLMFLRYVPLLARLGAHVIAWVPTVLVQTVARVEGIAGVRATDAPELDCDFHCPFISLPRAFALRQGEAWGAPVPYLRTDADRVRAASAHLPPPPRSGRLRVGLAWGGAPRPDNLPANAIDRRRSLPLRLLAPLADVPGVTLVSLQVGPYADQLVDPPEGLQVIDPTGFIGNMDDTASLVASLDLVVSVDTSVAHLAGGLGARVILLDRYDNCWRWFHGRTDSPWYPGLEIIRQDRPGHWDGVVARLCDRLRELAAG